MKNSVLDLFCGAGGMSSGFQHAGFKIVGGIDNDKAAIHTHSMNFPSNYNYCGDISNISNEEIIKNFNDVDVIVGGPPCQGFSSANRYEREEDDPRNKLFFEYLRFIRIISPKVFVIENVPGILTRNKGYAKNKIIDITSKLGYNVKLRVLKSEEYGVPQKRRRAFFIGIKSEYNTSFNFDNLKPIVKRSTVFDAIGDLVKIEGKKNVNTLLDINCKTDIQKYFCNNDVDKVYNHDFTLHNEKVISRIKCVPEGGNWREVPDNLWENKRTNRHSSAYKRLCFNEPSITIDTGHMNYFHPSFNRIPTVRESARIQSFDDKFIFYGTKTQQFRQVGNAVPPLLAQSIANEIKKIIKE
jgi:DNA (cytosine-5)-methyltransferase 1